MNIPVTQEPISPSIPLQTIHREFDKVDRVNTIISSYISSLYTVNINWNNMYISKFTSNYSNVPSIAFKSKEKSGVCLNADLATVSRDMKKGTITIADYNSFSACLLYGLNKLLLHELDDEQYLSNLYYASAGFIYALIIRSYNRDYDFMSYTDQDLANIYYCVAKLVASQYVIYSGNINAVATVATRSFFTNKETKKMAKIDLDKLPKNIGIYSYGELFSYLEQTGLMDDITISSFREKISNMLSGSVLVALSSGMELIAMLGTIRLQSNVFNTRLASIRPASVVSVMKTMTSILVDKRDTKQNTHDNFYLDSW